MKRFAGFTLLELVFAMVILGLLSAVAIPKFINLSRETRIAKVQQMTGSVKAASSLINLKCRITPTCDLKSWGGNFVLDGRTAQLLYGWLDAGTVPGIGNVGVDAFIETNPHFMAVVTPDHTETQWRLISAPTPSACYAFYRQQPGPTAVPNPDIAPTVGNVTSGC